MSYFRAVFFFQMATEVLEDLLEEDDEVVEVCVSFLLSFVNGRSTFRDRHVSQLI